MAVVVEGVKAVACRDELFDGAGLLFGEPVLRLGLRKIFPVLQSLLVGRVRIRAKIASGPDHAVT